MRIRTIAVVGTLVVQWNYGNEQQSLNIILLSSQLGSARATIIRSISDHHIQVASTADVENWVANHDFGSRGYDHYVSKFKQWDLVDFQLSQVFLISFAEQQIQVQIEDQLEECHKSF